jgi:hypothetical protein
MEAQKNYTDITLILFIVFLVLKLTHQIDWSWWWVTSPLWIPLVVMFTAILFAAIIAIILDLRK